MGRQPAIQPGAKDGVTQGNGTPHGPGAVQDWLGGLADTKLIDKTIDPDSHNLHAAVGQTCARCGRVIEGDQPMRRTVSGAYKHDCC